MNQKSNPEPATVQPLRSVEQLVVEYLDLQDQAARLADRLAGIKAQIGDQVGVDNSLDVNGVQVSVRAPSRSFNLARAVELLTEEQKQLCQSLDAKKVKAQLPPVLTEQCMDPGRGNPVVTIR